MTTGEKNDLNDRIFLRIEIAIEFALYILALITEATDII